MIRNASTLSTSHGTRFLPSDEAGSLSMEFSSLTPFHDRFSTQEFLDRIQGNTPVGRHGASEEIAKGIAFLIENEFTTGETLDINGGLFMR